MRKTISVGVNLPKDMTIRAYVPGQDDAEVLRLQEEANAAWRDKPGAVIFDPALPPNPKAAFVVEKNGRLVAMTGCRVVLELGCRIDESEFPSMAAIRDVVIHTFAKMLVAGRNEGFDRIVCSVTSPTPGWVNFLKKRLGFKGFGRELLSFQIEEKL